MSRFNRANIPFARCFHFFGHSIEGSARRFQLGFVIVFSWEVGGKWQRSQGLEGFICGVENLQTSL